MIFIKQKSFEENGANIASFLEYQAMIFHALQQSIIKEIIFP